MLKQPSGTNHFQFRFHQFGLGVGETGGSGGICSTATLYAERELLRNQSLCRSRSLTDSVAIRQNAAHEITTLSPNYFCRRVDCADERLRDDSIRSGRARRHMDQLVWCCLDNQP